MHVDTMRAVDLEVATGVYPDMTEDGWPVDAWPPNTDFMTWNLLRWRAC